LIEFISKSNLREKLNKPMTEQDQAFLEMIVKAIVAKPDAVSVNRTVDERGVLLTLDIHPEDMGYVIGRRGQTAQAIRTLLKIVGAKNNARVNLKINEPEGSTRPARPAASSASTEIDTSSVDDLRI
jgi:predicted RNA-binding protein YlqC (UPF0109 family)